jgi:hypothetical protein
MKFTTIGATDEMVQVPCAHVVLNDRIYSDFTDLVIEFT